MRCGEKKMKTNIQIKNIFIKSIMALYTTKNADLMMYPNVVKKNEKHGCKML